jgi:hypothetical protein
MSRSYWLPYITAVGIALAGAVNAQPVGHDAGGQTSASKAQDKPQTDKNPITFEAIQHQIEGLTRALVTAIDKPKPTEEETRAKRDLAAQEGMAFWAKLMFFAAGAEAFLTMIGVFLVWRTLLYTKRAVEEAKQTTAAAIAANVEAKRQADLAEESFKRLERPYLFIKIVETFHLRNIGQNEIAWLAYTLVNYGKSPAILRSVAIGLQDNPDLPLRTPMAIENKTYDVIESGGELAKNRSVKVTQGVKGKRYTGAYATMLILHGYVQYDDPTGAFHHDRFCLRGMNGGAAFEIEGGEEYNSRTTTYPKPKSEKS